MQAIILPKGNDFSLPALLAAVRVPTFIIDRYVNNRDIMSDEFAIAAFGYGKKKVGGKADLKTYLLYEAL